PQVNGTITITDEAGNTATATDDESVKIDTTPPVVTLEIDTISGDGFINADEAAKPTTTISGTVGGDAKAGDVVHLEVNDKAYTAEVYTDKDGKLVWQTEVTTSDLINDPQVNGTITITDEAGNTATATDDESVKIDTTPPVVTLEIDTISDDGFINADEAAKPTTTISGTVGGDAKAGDVVHLEVNDKAYTAEVYADKDGKLVWQTEVTTSDLIYDPQVNGTITIRDEAGNTATATDDESVKIDTTPPVVTLEIDTISDGYINAAESKEPTTTVKGTVGGDAKAGDVVHLEVNGNAYTTEVYTDKDGKLVWQTEVATSDLLANQQVNGAITITDEAGNEATATDDETVTIDTTPPVVELKIDIISGDGFINAAESKEPTTTVKGTVGGDAKAGDVVHLEINGKDYPATVVAGEGGTLVWQTKVATSDLLADPQVYGSITITDEAGNEATATDDETVKIDTTPPVVTLEIDVISGDGFINADEAEKTTTTISGTVGGDAKAGDVVQLEVNGNKYTAEVVADKDGKLVWQTEVATSDLIAKQTVNGTITITDEAGNKATAIDKETVIIDTEIDVTVTIDPVTGDDFLSFAETNQLPGKSEPLIKVTGTVTGEAEAGDIVDVKVGDVTQKVTLTDDGKGNLVWEAEFTASNMMNNPKVSASISISDPAGNTASDSTSRPVTIETGNLITGDEKDNVINGGDTSDIIIADTQGFQQLPGQDYNIAFVVDSSGSVGATDIKSIIASLTMVFNALHQNAQLVNSGDVKILLVDFDAQVNFAVSVNLKDSGALKTLTDALAKMTSGGGTNYEDAFKTTSNWFHDVSSSSSENLTYFITDGKPTYYQSGEKTSVDVDGRSGNNNVVMLDVTKLDYHPGQVVSMNINGTSRVVIDASGNVYSWNGSTRTSVGIMRADGKGGYEISVRAGSGSSTTTDTTTNSTYAFGLLMAMCGNVEAIGINNGIKASDLIAYDSDGKVTAGISASELANAILGGDYVQMAGAQDTVHGNGGNDVIFGDMLQFGDKTGYAAIQEYVAGKLNIAVNQLEVSHIAQYISEHPAEFDQSQADGGRDVLFGGVGNDILYGGGGDDILVGGSGDDVLFGGKGDDILIGDGFDSMADMASHLNTSVNQLTFDKVVDYVTQHSEELGAIGSGNDKLYGGEGNDLLMGGGGNDILNGGEGNDLLFGGTGNDVLIGGKGNDTLYGGTGSDTFTWLKGDDGHDVIKDFRADEGDRIDLSDLLGDVANTDLASYIKVTDDNHGNTVIEINTNGQMQSGSSTMSITVENCTSADIDINSLIAKPDAPVI
ncbi:Ig-like domain-containing protein, partial [Kluyvera intermedia]